MNRRGLGRGLDALLSGDTIDTGREKVIEVEVASIIPNRFQPRRDFDPERLSELAASIREYGVLQPIVLRKRGNGFELVAGERRWRATQLAGLGSIPALVREYSDMEMTAVALVENLQRENLNPVEEALAYRRLIDEFGFNQDDVAQKVGKSRSFIANSVRLLNLPPVIQEHVSRGTMSPGQARPLLVLPTAELQEAAAEKILSQALTARDAEELARQWGGKSASGINRNRKSRNRQGQSDCKELEDRLEAKLGTRVRISEKGAGCGTITIEYYSVEEFQRILECFEETHDGGASERKRDGYSRLSV